MGGTGKLKTIKMDPGIFNNCPGYTEKHPYAHVFFKLHIFNPEKKLESIIEKAPKKFILATKDIGDNCMLNSGVFFLKSHQYTKNLITKWRDFKGDKSSLYASGGDQEILCEILRKSDGYGLNRKIFEMNEFNTDPRLVNEDTFILHFMAYPHELKKIFMSYWCS